MLCSVWLLAIIIFGFLPRESRIPESIAVEIISEPDTLSIPSGTYWVIPKEVIQYEVTVTIYHAVPEQTDSTPDILADGTKIDLDKAGSYRYCALSRDLLSRWDGPYSYGDTVRIYGVEQFSGLWIVKDTMHPRWTNRVDLLVDMGTKPYKFEVAKLRSL